VIHVFREQSSFGVEIWQIRELEFLSLNGQVRPLRVAPQTPRRARLSILFREDDTLGIHYVIRPWQSKGILDGLGKFADYLCFSSESSALKVLPSQNPKAKKSGKETMG